MFLSTAQLVDAFLSGSNGFIQRIRLFEISVVSPKFNSHLYDAANIKVNDKTVRKQSLLPHF